MTTAQQFDLTGTMDFVGVRLRPGAIKCLFNLPASGIVDDAYPTVDVIGSLPGSAAQLADEHSFSRRCGLLSEALRSRVSANSMPDTLVVAALKRLSAVRDGRATKVSAIVADFGVSERAFERRFRAHVGMSPVQFRRLARFRAALRLYFGGLHDWSRVASVAGFSDQSHLVREFLSWAGASPTAWVSSQQGPAGFVQDGNVAIG